MIIKNAGSIYVASFSNSVVKIGCTAFPERVQGRYNGDARRFGITLASHWVSGIHREYRENERKLKQWCKKNGKPMNGIDRRLPGEAPSSSGEYFTSVSASDIIKEAISLPMSFTDGVASDICELAVDWRSGIAYVATGDIAEPKVHEVIMNGSEWVSKILVIAAEAGASRHEFINFCLIPVFIRAGLKLPSVIQRSGVAPVVTISDGFSAQLR